MNKEAFNYLRFVLSERGVDPIESQPLEKGEILKMINEKDKPTEAELKKLD